MLPTDTRIKRATGVIHLLEETSEYPITALVNCQAKPATLVIDFFNDHTRRLELSILQNDPLFHDLKLGLGYSAFNFNQVGLGDIETRMLEFLRKIAVIGQEDQALRIVIQAADRENSLGDIPNQIGNNGTPLGIAQGRNVAGRFVQHQINAGDLHGHQLAVNPDLVIGARFRSKLPHNPAIDPPPDLGGSSPPQRDGRQYRHWQ